MYGGKAPWGRDRGVRNHTLLCLSVPVHWPEPEAIETGRHNSDRFLRRGNTSLGEWEWGAGSDRGHGPLGY